jgi:hypothetical protein
MLIPGGGLSFTITAALLGAGWTSRQYFDFHVDSFVGCGHSIPFAHMYD